MTFFEFIEFSSWMDIIFKFPALSLDRPACVGNFLEAAIEDSAVLQQHITQFEHQQAHS